MKRYSILLIIAFLPGVVRAQDRLRIQRIGLQEYYATSIPTPVRIHIPALTQGQTIHLDFVIESGNSNSPAVWLQTDRFSKALAVEAGTPLEVDVPILFTAYAIHNMRVVATDSQGRQIGEDSRILAQGTMGLGTRVAIYCGDNSQCIEAESQTYPVKRDEDQPAPRNDLQYIRVKELETNWLTYHAASALVIAGSLAGMLPEQGRALEYYLRSGGTLVLIEKEAGNADFLAAYRQGESTLKPVRVGRGRLFRISSLESKELVKLFTPIQYMGARKIFTFNYGGGGELSSAGKILTAVGTSFSFPRLRTLLIWIGIYILVIGLANFAILRWLRKLEWGWLTVSVTALVFAAGFYFTSSSGRPSHFTLDTATVYWMDGHSPVASSELGFRITSPERKEVALSINDDVLLGTSQSARRDDSSGVYLGSTITGNDASVQGWSVQVAPPLRIAAPMRRWSIEEFYSNGFHEFSGTVHWTSPTTLKNDTGLKFSEALYVDMPDHKVFPLPGMSPGEEVDLASISSKPYRVSSNELLRFTNPELVPTKLGVRLPFSLEAFLWGGIYSLPTQSYFGGVVEQSGSIAGLDAPGTIQQNVVVAVVALDQP